MFLQQVVHVPTYLFFLFQIMANLLNETEDDLFFQCAQDPLADFDEHYPNFTANTEKKSNLKSQNRIKGNKVTKRKRVKSKVKCGKWKVTSSFVQSRSVEKASKLIKISIVDISDSDNTCVSDSENRNKLVKAHYLIKDCNDDILEQTERIINNISKKLCGYSTCIYM